MFTKKELKKILLPENKQKPFGNYPLIIKKFPSDHEQIIRGKKLTKTIPTAEFIKRVLK